MISPRRSPFSLRRAAVGNIGDHHAVGRLNFQPLGEILGQRLHGETERTLRFRRHMPLQRHGLELIGHLIGLDGDLDFLSPRTTVSMTFWPMFLWRICFCNSRGVFTGVPSTATITSAGCRSLFAAGVPSRISVDDDPFLHVLSPGQRNPCHRRRLHDADPDPRALDLAFLDELVGGIHRHADRDGETRDAAVQAANQGVDADDAAFDVAERAARIARVDRRVGLDVILVRIAAMRLATPLRLFRADDSHGERVIEFVRRADGNRPLPDLDRVAVADLAAGRFLPSTLITATSMRSSMPTTTALVNLVPSFNSTVI